MTFALTHYRSYGLDVQGAVRRRAVQRAVFDITAATSDVDLDLGSDAGTFWTAALADSTYGDLATEALAAIQDIVENGTLVGYTFDSLFDRVQAAAASGSAYAVAIENSRINITMAASNGETTYRVTFDYELDNDQLPVAAEYGGD